MSALRVRISSAVVVVAGREQHLDEQLGEALGQRHVHGAVDGDHAAEGAHRIAGERLVVGGGEVLGERAAAGVVVLDDASRRAA